MRNSFRIIFPGREIPMWFSDQSRGSSISFPLPPNWFNNSFLGFAYAAVGFEMGKSDSCYIEMSFKCHVTQRIIEKWGEHIPTVNFGNMVVRGIPRGAFSGFTEDDMEQLNESGFECRILEEKREDESYFKVVSEGVVEKVGVHVIYKEAEEQALSNIYNFEENNNNININMGVFHGDLDRSAGVQVGSSSSSSSATTSKRRLDDHLNDNHYHAAAAAASGSPGIDDQEDHLDNLTSKRIRIGREESTKQLQQQQQQLEDGESTQEGADKSPTFKLRGSVSNNKNEQ